METIDIKNIGNYAVNGYVDVACSFRADKDGTEVKNVTLRIHYQSVSLRDIITKSTAPVRISWQNGPGRNRFNTWKDRQTIDVNFTSPAAKVKTREEQIEEYRMAFMKAGLDKPKATELATKAVDNPELIT